MEEKIENSSIAYLAKRDSGSLTTLFVGFSKPDATEKYNDTP